MDVATRKRSREDDDLPPCSYSFEKRPRFYSISEAAAPPYLNFLPGSLEAYGQAPSTAVLSQPMSPSITLYAAEPSPRADVCMQELVSFASPIVFAPPPKFRGQALYRTAPLKPPAAGYSSMGSRIPTPIYGHFQEANLLATNTVQPETGWRNGDVLTGSMDIDEPPTCQTTLLPTRSRQSSRTLPSPISESGPDTPTSATEGHLARLTVIGSDECMDVDSSDPDDSPEPFFLPLRGRKRSIAVPTEKRRFCMGYRDDCEKCKARVPGHFSHFLTG